MNKTVPKQKTIVIIMGIKIITRHHESSAKKISAVNGWETLRGNNCAVYQQDGKPAPDSYKLYLGEHADELLAFSYMSRELHNQTMTITTQSEE